MIEGLRPLPKDDRDYNLGAVFSLPKLEKLPERFEIPPLKIIDQKGNDFCSAATRAGQKAIMEDKMPFYPALFAISKEISGDADKWGQDMRTAFKASLKSVPLLENAPEALKNALQREDWEYLRDINNYPPEYIESGRQYADGSFFVVKSPFYDAFDTARAALWKFKNKKQTIAVGVIFTWILSDEKLTGTRDGGFGHMMFINGWTEDGLIITNSYGNNAGTNGKHIITRETINYFADKYGMMMGVDLSQEKAKYYAQGGIKETDNWLVKLFKTFLSFFTSFRAFGGKRSSHWRRVRKESLGEKPRCAVCGGKKGLSVHHKVPFHIDKTKELDLDNLITLCDWRANNCHRIFGHLLSFYSYNDNVAEDAKNFNKKPNIPYCHN